MKIVEAPNDYYSIESAHATKIFLAGGITNCPDWQSEVVAALEADPTDAIVYNPRRKDFPIGDPSASEMQIAWEYDKLKNADVIAFWFSRGSLNPIVLYELGMWGNSRETDIVIGVDPEYERIQDVEIQTALARPGHDITTDFNTFIARIKFSGK